MSSARFGRRVVSRQVRVEPYLRMRRLPIQWRTFMREFHVLPGLVLEPAAAEHAWNGRRSLISIILGGCVTIT